LRLSRVKRLALRSAVRSCPSRLHFPSLL
jgi:hypothetical protein